MKLQQYTGPVQAKGLEAVGAPIVAYYDAPFLPPMLRRNEVMLRLKERL